MSAQSRQLAAIMFTDIVGYTLLMGEDEERAFQLLKKNREVQRPIIEKYGGKWLKEIGDGVLASFSTVSDAVYCAIEIQKTCEHEPDLKLRIGIHEGEVVFEDNDVFGDGVNIASRLEPLAPIGGILVSESVHKNVLNKKGIETEFLREENLKNVRESVKIYQVIVEPSASPDKKSVVSSDTKPEPAEGKPFNWFKLIIIAFIALIFFMIGYFLYYSLQNRERAIAQTVSAVLDEPINSIAVLPFINMSENPELEHWANGITEAITLELSKIGALNVISRTTAMKFKDTKMTATEIADEIDVDALLEGSVMPGNTTIRITAQLINVFPYEKHLWQESYDHELTDILILISNVAQDIAESIDITIRPEEAVRIQTSKKVNSEAYEYYLKGRHLWNQGTPLALNKSIDYYIQSIFLDSNYAPAYLGLGRAYNAKVCYCNQEEARILKDSTRKYINKALNLDPELAEAYAAQSNIYGSFDWNWDKMKKMCDKCLEMDPNNPSCYQAYKEYWLVMGDFSKAIAVSEKAVQLDPLNHRVVLDLGFALSFAGRYDEALTVVKQVVELNPAFPSAWSHLGMIYYRQNLPEKASQSFAKQHELIGNSDVAEAYRQGSLEEGLRFWLERAKSTDPHYASVPSAISLVHMMLGEKEEAIHWLELSIQEKNLNMANRMPEYKLVRDDPRFKELMKKMNFPP